MDILTEWPLTLAIILYILWIFFYNKLTSKSYKFPPGPPKLPIFGNLYQLSGQLPHEAFWKLSKTYGPLMQLHIGSKQFLIINSSDMAKHVLKTQDNIFCSREVFHSNKQLTYNFLDVAASPHGAHWREMRKLLVTEFVGSKRAKLTNHVLVTRVESMISSLSLLPPNTEVNLTNMFVEIVMQILCRITFGNSYGAQTVKGPSLDVMLQEAQYILNGSAADAFPFLGTFINQFSGYNRRLKDGVRNIDVYLDTIIDDHRKHKGEDISEEDKDFVQILLDRQSSKENASGYQLTNDHLKALVMDILLGGIDTSSLTMIWAMSEIISNPRVMQKLQNEIRTCTGRINKVDELDITKLKYLKMVVKETMRFHPSLPLLLPHHSLRQTQIAGYDVLPNTTVLINAWGIGRDPCVWGDNAETEFYPERFETLDGDFGRDRFEMLPFGGGRRSCPAMNTAPVTVEFVLANLLYWFDWELPSGIKTEELNMEVEEGAFVLGKKVPLCLVPTKHKWED